MEISVTDETLERVKRLIGRPNPLIFRELSQRKRQLFLSIEKQNDQGNLCDCFSVESQN
ncbi:hypothetical protein [Lysinibacillus sp. G4S2]|uniref:hypothetical protein n=1 Tax=Lysinibacillus sp. G4S2 TaxID=3055859 RepID=UPI0025A132FB|nr:hypothetical protein [Lysinibacillus sp. G4S2]MDM5246225.1 hypothetical protein [Lysinibacillus sp. G4S2]